MKTKTIKLAYQPVDAMYYVMQITDSTEYQPGARLNGKVVSDLCASKAWRVTVVPSHKAGE